jgi:hypothetical protein
MGLPSGRRQCHDSSVTRNSITSALLAVAVLVTLVGCTPPTPEPEAEPPATETAAADPTAEPSSEPAPDLPQTTDDPCLREILQMTYTAVDNTAGHAHGVLTFTNTSDTVCNLEGYPSVWFSFPEASDAMGAKVTIDPASPVTSFDLAPGATATAQLTIVNAGNVEGCDPADADSLLEIPPLPGEILEDRELWWRYVPIDPTPACRNDDLTLLTVGAMVLDQP